MVFQTKNHYTNLLVATVGIILYPCLWNLTSCTNNIYFELRNIFKFHCVQSVHLFVTKMRVAQQVCLIDKVRHASKLEYDIFYNKNVKMQKNSGVLGISDANWKLAGY